MTRAVDLARRGWDAVTEDGISSTDVLSSGSTTLRSLGDRFADVVNVKDFGAVGDGVTDDTAAIQAAIDSIQTGDKLTGRGVFKCTSTIARNFQRAVPRITIDIQGEFIFTSTNGISLVGLIDSDVTLGTIAHTQTVEDDLLASDGFAIEFVSCWTSRIDVTKTTNFLVGTKLVGGRYNDGAGNGMAFNDIRIRNTRAPTTTGGTGCLVTTEQQGTTAGYFNENRLDIGFMRAETGIKFEQGVGQTDRFNGNKLLYPQIENVSVRGISLDYCRSNTILFPRFEGGSTPSEAWIIESANCSRNDIYITGAVDVALFELNGVLTSVNGAMNTANGSYVANQLWGGDSSNPSGNNDEMYLARTRGVHTRNNTLYFGGIPGQDKWSKYAGGVRTRDGVDKVFGLLNPIGQQSVINLSGDVQIDSGVSLLSVSTTGSGMLSLGMNSDREINGYTMYLEVRNFSQPLEIKKSNGTITVVAGTVSEAGMYLLAYFGDQWKVTKLGSTLGG